MRSKAAEEPGIATAIADEIGWPDRAGADAIVPPTCPGAVRFEAGERLEPMGGETSPGVRVAGAADADAAGASFR